jgi:hypothetical protein
MALRRRLPVLPGTSRLWAVDNADRCGQVLLEHFCQFSCVLNFICHIEITRPLLRRILAALIHEHSWDSLAGVA